MIGTDSVLRVSSLSDRNIEDYEAEIEYVHYLSKGGASVVDSIPSGKGNRIEMTDEKAVTMFEIAKGDQIAAHGYRYIDGVPIEDPREGRRDHAGDAARLDGDRSMLS